MSDQWFYGEDGQQRGPVPLEALRARIAAGQTRGDDLVWREGMPNWMPAANVPELAGAAPTPASAAPLGATPITPDMQAAYQPGYAAADFEAARLTKAASSALIFGIVGLVTSAICCPLVGIGFGVAAIVKGRNARLAPNAGSALAGVICGTIAIIVGVISMIAGAVALPDAMRQVQMNQSGSPRIGP